MYNVYVVLAKQNGHLFEQKPYKINLQMNK